MKTLYKKECEDCSTQAEVEVLGEILDKLRDILKVPDGKDVIHWAKKIVKTAKKQEGTYKKGDIK